MTITNGYCTEAQAIPEIFRSATPTTDQLAALDMAIEAASREIDQFCNRRFYLDTNTSARVYSPQNWFYCFVDDIGDTTGMQVATDVTGTGNFNTIFASTDYQTEIQNAIARGRPVSAIRAKRAHYFPILGGGPFITAGASSVYMPEFFVGDVNWGQGLQTVQVTAKWGWPAVPTPVVRATIIQTSMLYKAPDAPFGVTGTLETGTLRLSKALHPQAEALVRPYRRNAGGVID